MPKSWLVLRRICLSYLKREVAVQAAVRKKFDFCELAIDELKKIEYHNSLFDYQAFVRLLQQNSHELIL